MKIGTEVWQFSVDYPGLGGSDDSKLPLGHVSVKAWDEIYWMSTFDEHPAAISGPTQIAKLVKTYGAQGIGLYLWCVPKGRNVSRQLSLSKACLDVAGVKGLIFDVEPFRGFCAGDCAYLATTLMKQLRAARPKAWLGVTYDPRPQHWGPSGTSEWLRYANGALPMVYWRSFAGQGVWASPSGAVKQAEADLRQKLAPGAAIEYVPLLQGNAAPGEVVQAIDAAPGGVSTWRRGVVTVPTWSAVRVLPEKEPPTPPPADCSEAEAALATCTQELSNARAEVRRLSQVVTEQHQNINQLTTQLTSCQQELATARSELATCRTQLQLALDRAKACEEFLAAMKVIKDTVIEL